MQKIGINVQGDAVTAATTNVALAMRALERAMNRDQHLPGLVGFYGPAGIGKSFGAAYAANQHRAYYIEIKSTWTKKKLLESILQEMQIKPARTIYDMADQAAEQLALCERPLIIDQFDILIDRSSVEIIRDLHDAAGSAPILLIGEEDMEKHLRRWERFHSRMLEWIPAQPATLDDARKLRALYCPHVDVADDLLHHIHQVSRGGTRRICINLSRVQEFGIAADLALVNLNDWGNQELYTGEAIRRRAA